MPNLSVRESWPRSSAIFQFYRQALRAIESLPSDGSDTAGRLTDDELSAIRTELEDQVVMKLSASFEALLQLDLRDRVRRRPKERAADRLRKLWYAHQKTEFIPVDRILAVWKKTHGHSLAIGRLNQLFQYRHWLAHGRYWVQKSGLRRLDPFDAWQIAKLVFDELPGFPTLDDKLPGKGDSHAQ